MSDNEYMTKFVHRVLIALAIKGITRQDVIRKTGINNAFLLRLNDTKKSSNPRLSTLMKISGALDMSIEELVALPDKAKGLVNEKYK